MSDSDMDKYKDMLDMPHHVSTRHAPLSMAQRAAQFLPFQPLTGYEDVIREAGRLTENDVSLTEDEKDALDFTLDTALENGTCVRVRFFEPDAKKEGGAMRDFEGIPVRVDDGGNIVFQDRTRIPVSAVRAMEEV